MEFGVLILSLLVCVVVASAAVTAIRKIAPRPESLPVTADWINELSVDRYRPMLRLLQEDDLHALRSQPGFTNRMATDLRRERCEIFRGYLRSLRSDFARVCLALKLVMLQAREDRSDLASLLIRSQLAFTWGVALVQVRLALYTCGIGTVDIGDLLKLFDSLRVELRTLVPAAMAAGA